MGSTDRQGGRDLSRDRQSVPQVATPVYATQAALAAAVTDAGNALAALTTSVNSGLAGKSPTAHPHAASEITVDTTGMTILRGDTLQDVLASLDTFLAGL